MDSTGFHLPHNAIIPEEVRFILGLIDTDKEYYLYDELKAMVFEEEIRQHVFEDFHKGMFRNFQREALLTKVYNDVLDGKKSYEEVKKYPYTGKKTLNGCWNEYTRDYFEMFAFIGLLPSYYKGKSNENEKRYYVGETLKKYKSGEYSFQDLLFKMKFRNASKNYDNLQDYDVENRPFVVAVKILDILKQKGFKQIDGTSLSYLIRTTKSEEELKKTDRIKPIDFSNETENFIKEVNRGVTFLNKYLTQELNISLVKSRNIVYDLTNFDIKNYKFKDKAVFLGNVYGTLEVTPLFLKYLDNPRTIDDEDIKDEMIANGLIDENNNTLCDFNADTDLQDRNLVKQFLRKQIVEPTIHSNKIEATDLYKEGERISQSSDGTAYEKFLYKFLKDKFKDEEGDIVHYLGANTMAQRFSDIYCNIPVLNEDDSSINLKIIIESKAGSAIKAFDERKESNNITNTLSLDDIRDFRGIWYIIVDSTNIPSINQHGGFRKNAYQLSFMQKLLKIQSSIMQKTGLLTMVTAFSYKEFMKFMDTINYDERLKFISQIQAPDFWTWSSKFVDTSYVSVRA